MVLLQQQQILTLAAFFRTQLSSTPALFYIFLLVNKCPEHTKNMCFFIFICFTTSNNLFVAVHSDVNLSNGPWIYSYIFEKAKYIL